MLMEAAGVRLLNPGRDEPAMYTDTFTPGPQFNGVTSALIRRTPGLSGNGEALPTHLPRRNGHPAESRSPAMLPLRLPSGQLPRFFQAMLKVEFRNGVPV